MKMRMHIALVCLMASLFIIGADAQGIGNDQVTEKTAVREELRSYMGYEDNLAALYLTLPYDVSVGNNQQSRLIDMGILIAAFLPLLYLLSGRVRKRWRVVAAVVLLGYLGLISIYSTLISPDGRPLNLQGEDLAAYRESVAIDDGLPQAVTADFYAVGQTWGQVFSLLLEAISGPSDYVTYPLMIGLFMLALVMTHNRFKNHITDLGSLMLILIVYGFLWWLFSGGIIWYGFLLVPLSYVLVTNYMLTKETPKSAPLVAPGMFAFMSVAWAVPALLLFFSNLNYRTDTGQNLIDLPAHLYALGYWDSDDVINAYYPGVSQAMRAINADEEALVYRAGTMLTFQVDKNDRRVFEDNLLDFFNQVAVYSNDEIYRINEAFRRAGLKYFIVGLKIGASDRTPEGSLRLKFEKMMSYLLKNPEMKLLVTDKKVRRRNPQTGEEEEVFALNGQTVKEGTYVIFQLN